jgi:predicted O-methyltransferase YrrM
VKRLIALRVRAREAFLRWSATHPVFRGLYLLRLRYPPSTKPQPRYGFGRPPHARLAEMLGQREQEYEQVLRGFSQYADALHAIPIARPGSPREPQWHNKAMFGLDGASLYCFARERAPRRYIEVGSGNSTLFVDRARRDGAIDMEITSIDPEPRRSIDPICDRVVREPLESADLGAFSALGPGDMVFLDGTHRVFTNSDAVVFFLDVLPELAPGVLVGIHDIHLPDDYPPEFTFRYYSEQYLLATYLLAQPTWLNAVLPCWYVSGHERLGRLVADLLPAGVRSRGVIFWLQTGARNGARPAA